MAQTVKDVIEWLKELPEDLLVLTSEYGIHVDDENETHYLECLRPEPTERWKPR